MAVEPRWITFDEAVETNAEQIVRFGGLPGVRDANLVHSAIAKPQNTYHYDGEDDVLALAVETGIAIARNHGFNDGNKRTGAVSLIAFLRVNGYRLDMPDDTLLGRMMEAVLTYDMTENEFADHIADHVYPDED